VSAAPDLSTPDLRARAEALGQTLPPLLAEAEMLASTVMLGEHGRRRAGLGDEFWQYRPAHQGDSARMIDWRRSARSDTHFVQEREWQAAQSVTIWIDPAKSTAQSFWGWPSPSFSCAAGSGWVLPGWRIPGLVEGSFCGWRPGFRVRWPRMTLAPPSRRAWSATDVGCSCRISWAT
jgi:hypothetical protein